MRRPDAYLHSPRATSRTYSTAYSTHTDTAPSHLLLPSRTHRQTRGDRSDRRGRLALTLCVFVTQLTQWLQSPFRFSRSSSDKGSRLPEGSAQTCSHPPLVTMTGSASALLLLMLAVGAMAASVTEQSVTSQSSTTSAPTPHPQRNWFYRAFDSIEDTFKGW